MKKTFLPAAICLVLSFASKAQCDKNIKWVSSKSEFIDTANGKIKRSKDETVELTASPKKVSIVIKGDNSDFMNGAVTDYSCDWKDRQNGKIVLKSILTDMQGDVRHAIITIEKIDGKTTALFKAEEEPIEIRLTIDSFAEAD